MNARQVYERCVLGLDKYNTPSFEIEDFNDISISALNEYLNQKYKVFEQYQKITDDLRLFVKEEEFITNNVSFITLPSDYRHTLKVTYQINDGQCLINKWITAKKTTADKLGYSEDNYYLKPSLKNVQYQIIGDRIYFRVGDNNNTIKKVKLEYITVGEYYYINPLDIDDFNNPNYTDMVDDQLIDKIIRMFNARVLDPRYQVNIQEENLKTNF